MTLRLPTHLAQSLLDEINPERSRWVERLPQIVDELAQRWSLRVGEPYDPGGTCSWVAPARGPQGRDLVLKVGWLHDEARSEADGLRAWDGRGAVLLVDAHTDGTTSALLLERCSPGTPLGHAVEEPEQDIVVAELLTQLWIEPAANFRFRPLQAMCDSWAAALEARLAASPPALDHGLVRAGLALFRSLPATADRSVLLCTDLHAENILAAARQPWLAIDPKPYLGDPAYDPLQHMLNCEERLIVDPAGLTDRMAGLLGIDRHRLGQWLFARCVLESLDQPLLGQVAERLAPA